METRASINVRQLSGALPVRLCADKGKTFNTNLMFTSGAWLHARLRRRPSRSQRIERKESRGAHTREDMPRAGRRELAEAHPGQEQTDDGPEKTTCPWSSPSGKPQKYADY